MAESSQRVTEVVGLSSDPSRGVDDNRPYEFFTDAGVHVYLHDAKFLGMIWQPDTTLRLYFAFGQDWTPPEAKKTPIVELKFSEVQVEAWDTDLARRSEAEPVGQVSDFAWNGRDTFRLQTYTLMLSFSSSRMEVRLAAFAPDALTPTGGPG